MSSYRSGSVGRFDYSLGSGSGSSSSRYRPSQASSSSYTSRYSSSTANPISSTSIGGGGGLSRSYRAASYDPFSSDTSSTRSTATAGITSYRSPYNRESGSSILDRPSASTAMSNSYSDYTSKSRYGGGGVSDRYGSGGYKPSTSSSIMSSSYTSALPSSSAGTSRYKGSTTTTGFPPPRSTSYASGLSFEPSSSRYGSGIPSRTSGMSSSTYTPLTSSSSYYSRPRIDYRSQTPSSITREPPTTSRFDREYRSMSRFDVKEPSVDRIEETFSKLYNRYVKGSEKIKTTLSSSSSSTTSSNQNSPIVKKFISHSEAEEEEFSCESEPEILQDYTKSLLQKSKVEFTFPEKKKNEAKEKTPTPAPNKSSISTSSTSTKNLAAAPAVAVKTDKSDKSPAAVTSLPQQKNVVQQPPLAATTKITAAETIKESPDKGSTTKASAVVTKPVAAAKAASSAPSSKVPSTSATTSRSKSPAPLTKASFEEKYKDLPKTEVVIEPKQIKGTSELDKLLRIAEFEKNPNKILSTSLPKVVQSAVKASTPAPAKPVVEKPVKASSEAPTIAAATVKVKETISAAKKEVSKEKTPEPSKKVSSSTSKEIKKEKTPEPTKKVTKEKTPEPSTKDKISVIKKESSDKPRSRSKSPAQQHLRSRSKSPSLVKSNSAAPEKQSLASKRAQRRERTIEMEKYVNSKLEQAKQEQEAADKFAELPKVTSERKPPLLLVTQPSVPSTPISLSANIVWNSSSNPNEEEGSESEWDEEDEEEDEEFYSEDDYDFTISLPSTGAPRGDLYPVDDSNRLRSITPYSDYDSEFEIPFIQPDSRNDSRGRVSQSNAAPPPIFLASVTYDGQDEWGSKHSADSDPDESQYFTVGSRLGVDSAGSRQTYLSPVDFPSEEDEYLDNVDVGCTLTLLDKAAMKGSDEETDSEFYSEYTDEEYTDEEYSYYEEEEEEYYTDEEIEVEEEIDEEWDDDIEMTASLYLPPTFKKSESPEPRRAKTPEPTSFTKTEAKKEKTPEPSQKKAETKAKTPEPKTVTKEKTPEPSKSVAKEKTPEPKKAVETKTSISKEKTPEPSKTTSTAKAKTPEPSVEKEVEVKKAADIKKEKTPDPKKTTDIKKEITPEPFKSVAKEKTPEPKKAETKTETKTVVPKTEPTKTVTKPKESTATSKPAAISTALPKLEDKSAIRKSTLNMAEIDKKKAEEKQAEIDRQNARLSGAVSSMRDRFRDPTPPKAEKITYRRSKLLQAREEIRPKRTYAPIVKPILNDEFDKQMEEIREKMKKGSHKLQAEYTNLSKGINSEVDERKLKSLESKHKDLIGSTQTLLTKAEEEKKRFSSKNESETEKRYRETLEKEEAKLRRLEEEKRAAMLVRPEPKKTVRRSKKKAEEEAAKAGFTEPLIPETSTSSNKSENKAAVEVPPAPKVPALTKKEESKPSLPSSSKVVEPKKVTPTSAAAAAPAKSFVPEAEKDDSDLEFIAAAMAKKKPATVSDAVMKSEAGGVASLLRRKAEKAASPVPPSNEVAVEKKTSPEKPIVERGPRRYSARRKTEEIIPPLKIESKENERKRKVQPHRKNRYTKKPFDIDALLGWEKENETFEKMEEFFEKQNSKRDPLPVNGDVKTKKRRIESQKIWISELKDIDKIYKASELRDIKMTAVS